jgi:hypothetical protein
MINKCIEKIKLVFFIICASSIILTTTAKSIESFEDLLSVNKTKYKRYGIIKGAVEYQVSGTKTGKQILYFDDWGSKEAKIEISEMRMAGLIFKENKLTILDGEWTYNIDMDKKSGSKIKTPLLKELTAKSKTNDLTEVGEKMLKQMGGKIIGQETVLGKKCDLWEVKSLGTKMWVWNYIPLKIETVMLGNTITINAVKIDLDSNINADKFSVPKDVVISDGPDLKSILNKIKR